MLSFILNTIASLLLGYFWLRFFRQVDVFEKESWLATLLCVVLGLLSPLITFLVSPLFGEAFDRSSVTGLLGYSVIQVGMVEEFSKILPFFIILFTTRWVDESLDFILYPALSAIGFATTENILYASSHGMEVLQYRAVLSLPGHVFFSVISGWFLYRGIQSGGGFSVLWFLGGYLLGVLSHGLYNFFLFLGGMWSLVSVVLASLFAFYIKKILFYCVRDSEFYNHSIMPEIFQAGRNLWLGMILLFIMISISAGLVSRNPMEVFIYVIANGFPALVSTIILLSLVGLDEKGFRKVLGIKR